MKKNSTKKALFASVLSLLLCASMLLGTTFAWFTDSVTSDRNIIQSGTLDVELYYSVPDAGGSWTSYAKVDESTRVFDYSLWEPGYTAVAKFKIVNEGTLALKYQLTADVFNETLGKTKDGADIKLSDHIKYGVTEDLTILDDRAAAAAVATNSFDEVRIKAASLSGAADDTETEVGLVLTMPETVGNEANHDGTNIPSIDFGINLLATQLAYESDSFDELYDKDAAYSDTAVGTYGGGDVITVGDVSVELPAGAAEGKYSLSVKKLGETTSLSGSVLSLDIELLKDGAKAPAVAGQEYRVKIDLGKNLIVTGVTHNGAAVADFSFDPATQELSFGTDSFSPFAVYYSVETFKVSSFEDFSKVLTDIRTSAKQQIPGETGNKSYREHAIIVLEEDIVIDANSEFMYTDGNGAPLHFYGVKGILDLNGHTITVTEDALVNGKTYANAVLLVQYSNIDIVGEGKIIANNRSIPVYGWANSTINIYGGTYLTNSYERNESAIYVNNPTVMIHVYDGVYTETPYAFNVHDNCGSTATITLHEGIAYKDYLKGGKTDVTQNDIDNGRIVLADGCELVQEGDGKAVNAK